MQFINLKKQYLRIQESLEDSLKNILDKSNFIQGEQVQILEEKLSSYVGANCITVANGTDAIFIALRSLGIGRGDEVILPSFTWVSTAETVSLTGAKPVFCDIDPDTFNISIKEASQKITEKTKAIIVVSIFGQTADLISAKELCEDKGITLIEDAAQSFGAMHLNERSCSIADISTTAFFFKTFRLLWRWRCNILDK